MAEGGAPREISRRSFVKYAAVGALAAAGIYSGLVYPAGWQKWTTYGQKPWEIAPGVVDYRVVLERSYGPPELGFDNDIRTAPDDAKLLNVAQWYDYWAADTIRNFTTWMETRWNVPGVRVRWTSNIYTSNEELFTWVTQTGRKFDLMFPTNYTAETMEKAGLLANMKREWIPNYVNVFGPVPTQFPPGFETTDPQLTHQPTYPGLTDEYGNGYNNPAAVDFRDPVINGYAYRGNTDTYPSQKPHPLGGTWGEQDGIVAVPYQWGTTGIGYRNDVFRKQDIEALGYEVFGLPAYTNPDRIDPDTGQPMTFNLHLKRMMLDDMREVFTAALKVVGWERQEEFKEQGLTAADPTAIAKNATPPYDASPFNRDFQWSSNEVDAEKLTPARDWLQSFKADMWGFNTPQQGPWLVSGTMYVDQAWSGDIMYAVRPNSDQHLPVDYFVPKQGGARWIDNAVIHRECERLWLAHEFINYLCDPRVGADISNWNLYGTPLGWSFELLHNDPTYHWHGRYPDGRDYYWNPAEDYRIYSDIAIDGDSSIAEIYWNAGRPPILERCEYQKDVGVRNTLRYFKEWRQVKF